MSENQSASNILQNQKFCDPRSLTAWVNWLSFETTVPLGKTRLSRGSRAVDLVQIVIAVQRVIFDIKCGRTKYKMNSKIDKPLICTTNKHKGR